MKGPLYLSCEMNLSQVQNVLLNFPSENRTVREVALLDIYVEQALHVVMLRVNIFQNEINLTSLQEGLIIKSPWAHWESAGGGCKPSICSIVTPRFLSRAAGKYRGCN